MYHKRIGDAKRGLDGGRIAEFQRFGQGRYAGTARSYARQSVVFEGK